MFQGVAIEFGEVRKGWRGVVLGTMRNIKFRLKVSNFGREHRAASLALAPGSRLARDHWRMSKCYWRAVVRWSIVGREESRRARAPYGSYACPFYDQDIRTYVTPDVPKGSLPERRLKHRW